MNYNQLWSGNRGRGRGNRGCGRGRRGGANMHYRGSPTFHRAVPPLFNTPESFYGPSRFRSPQESYNHLYPHPLNQEPSWPMMRNRHVMPNSRQAYLPATRVQPQIPTRSTSPLPGTEEYMQKNICEKSAFLKRQLELEGSCFNDPLNNFDLSDSDYQSDNTNNNFSNNTYQKSEEEEYDKPLQANESVPSPRRNKKQRQSSQRIMSVEEIHEKIMNHISNLSHGKKINLVNLPGPSGYDIAIQEITRQKRMELSKALRDICNNKFKETEDSSQVINSIIPDFDIKIEELPRELVEQLSSTLNENVTERLHNMCIDPELMFQQAAEMLNNSLDLDKSGEGGDNKVDFTYQDFPDSGGHEGMGLGLQNIEDSSLGIAIDQSMNQANLLNFQNPENCPPPQINFDASQSLNFNMTPSMNYMSDQSCSNPYDIGFPTSTNATRSVLEDSELFMDKSNADMDLYTPGPESSNSGFHEISDHPNVESINAPFELMDIPEPTAAILQTPGEIDCTRNISSELMSEEAELKACLAQTDPGLSLVGLNNTDKMCLITNSNTLVDKEDDFNNVDESLLHTNESQPSKDEGMGAASSNINENSECDNLLINVQKTFDLESVLPPEDRYIEKAEDRSVIEKRSDSPLQKIEMSDCAKPSDQAREKNEAESDQKVKAGLDLSTKKKTTKDKKGKSKLKDNESPKKHVEDEQQEKRQIEKRTKSKYTEDDFSRKSIDKEEFYDRSDRKRGWDKYSSAECSKEYANEEDSSERRKQDRRQDEKKVKGKYEEDSYRSDRAKYDAYQQSYDDNYKKKYKDSGADDDKHRRSDHKYRDVDSDLYHYSKYSADTEDGRNSKRYYQDKTSSYPYRQDYDYPYHKYDYPPSDYYQRQDASYPPEEYDQKTHYTKCHKNKHKKHTKKHKKHRDHSSGSNVSSSGSEKNSSTSSSYKTKLAIKATDSCDSPEDSSTNRFPKTSLIERIQVLCDTKMLNFKPELISPKVVEEAGHSSSIDDLPNNALINDADNVALIVEPEAIKLEDPVDEDVKSFEQNLKERSDCEDDLKAASEIEALECKKYSQRPWKSPGEKKFMMEHLNQNPAQGEEEDRKVDYELNMLDIKEVKEEFIVFEEFANKTENIALPVEHENNCKLPEETHNSIYSNEDELNTVPLIECDNPVTEVQPTQLQEINILNSTEVSSTSESAAVKTDVTFKEEIPIVTEQILKPCDDEKKDLCNMLVTTYTQTDPEKDHPHKKNKKDSKDKTRETHKEKLKSRQNSFTQTIVINATTSTQTHKPVDVTKNKTTQTDIINDSTKEPENIDTLDNTSKSFRRKRYIERMFEIDKEIEKLIKRRQEFYNLLIFDDLEKEVEAKASIAPEYDESKQKRSHKEKSKSLRETKTLNLESNKQKSQNSPKPNTTKQASPQKIEPETKPIEIATDSKEKQSTSQDTSKTRSKLKRGRPKRKQNNTEPENTLEKVEDVQGDGQKIDTNKKTLAKEETGKDVKSEIAKLKSTSKDKVESNRKRKNKDKVFEEHSKIVGLEAPSPKRHKGESVEKETKPVMQATEVKLVENETGGSTAKSRKKDKKPDNEKKVIDVDKMEEDLNPVNKDVEIVADEKEKNINVTIPTNEDIQESQLNDNATLEEVPTTTADPVIVEPKPFPIPEVSTSVKKKKRRLSGILDYRKKKKKSKNKNKKVSPPINPKLFSTPSAVNITRFSLTQLEEMREEIRSKKVGNESEPDDVKLEDSQIDNSVIVDSSIITEPEKDENLLLSTSEIEEKDKESVEQTVSNEDTNAPESQENTIEFKHFNGAILVIKVIETTVLAASDKGQLLYFNLVDGELIKTIDVSKLAVTALAVTQSNGEDFIYTGSLDSCLSIINFNSQNIIKQETLSEPVQCMETSWRYIFVGSDRGSIIRYDLNLEKVVDSLKVSQTNILMIKASQEGPRKVLIVAMRNSPVCVRDAISGLLLRTMQTSFSPTVYTLLIDKNLIYCGTSQHDILVYTFEDGRLVFRHEATQSKGVVCMQIVGNLLLAGCYNGNIYIYDTKNNVYLGTMNGPGGLMLSMEIVKDKIIVGTKSSNFKAWQIPQKYMDAM
ncbi:hypothetical protein RN001_000576 [Aquatica leii]|uniref:Zinc finger protein 106 n=1 Tax=Aquatica leii TaxID=1421715 RepID=A0AAN7PA67_9COLE|nr:hypothetical protein RN001_000576 [Aquatica leii]